MASLPSPTSPGTKMSTAEWWRRWSTLSKMASAGADWATNPATQITWGLGYIAGRYGTPCGAWSHSQSKGWY